MVPDVWGRGGWIQTQNVKKISVGVYMDNDGGEAQFFLLEENGKQK